MEFLPTLAQQNALLKAIGAQSIDDLFAEIPASVRSKPLALPPPAGEMETLQTLQRILGKNQSTHTAPNFVGGTLKEHHIPAFVGHVLSRQEFYTSYTPYQAELSQGTLQALFEFQSMLADLSGLGVANASMYDASTALAESALMARRVTGRSQILVPEHLADEKASTLANYCRGQGMTIVRYGFDAKTGRLDLASLTSKLGDQTAAVVLESPNFFGVWETEAAKVAKAAHDSGALAIMGFDLSSLGIAEAPGRLGADIAYGDGTTLCFPPSLGGPQLGLFACKPEHARKMPGRIIGASRDHAGGRAYCMTLQTREQHIRRDKATSNICTNQSLLAIGTGAHLAALGPQGLRRLGLLNAQAGARLARTVAEHSEWKPAFTGATYNEVTFVGPEDGKAAYERCGAGGITPGYPVSRAVASLSKHLVACSTEIHTDEDRLALARALGGKA